jgi:hypothetical protein
VHAAPSIVLGHRGEQRVEEGIAERQNRQPSFVVTGPDQSRLVPSIPSQVVVEEDGTVEHTPAAEDHRTNLMGPFVRHLTARGLEQ